MRKDSIFSNHIGIYDDQVYEFYYELKDTGRLLSFFHIEPGGAIYSNSQALSLTNCYFINNTAYSGGAIYIHQGTYEETQKLLINLCIFISNQAGDFGGGISVDQSVSLITALIKNCYFKANQAWCNFFFILIEEK